MTKAERIAQGVKVLESLKLLLPVLFANDLPPTVQDGLRRDFAERLNDAILLVEGP